MASWTYKNGVGWRCVGEGPHGPNPCGPVGNELTECACGCDDYYNCCPANQAWWEEQQRLAHEQKNRDA